MVTPLSPSLPTRRAALAPERAAALLKQARALQRAAAAGTFAPLLRGKNIGLLCEAAEGGEAALFRRAAAELGAQVAHVRPSLTDQSTPREIRHTALMLGRLYDAIECQDMAAPLVERLGREAGVPVYDGLASDRHPTACLADLLDAPAAHGDARKFILQAVLLDGFA